MEDIGKDACDSKASLEAGRKEVFSLPRVLGYTHSLKGLFTFHRFDVATELGRSRERYRRAALTTFTTLVAGAGLVFGTLVSFPAQRAQAFTSFLHGNWHGQITWSALRAVMQSGSGCRLSDAGAAVVMNSNINQDLLEMSLDSSDHLVPRASGHASSANCPVGWEPCPYRPEHHFDRVKSLSEDPSAVESAFESGLHYVIAKRGKIGQMVAENRARAALIALGRGLHAVQDVYSHSNYVDLYDSRSPANDELTADLLGTDVSVAPTSLLLTRFDWRDANPESPADADAPPDPSYAGFPYTHLRMAKDWDADNAESGLLIGGKTKFQMAETAATSASVQFILAVIKDSPGFCGQVSNWSPNDPRLDNTDPSDPDEPGKYSPSGAPKGARSTAPGIAFPAGGSEAPGGTANPASPITAGAANPARAVTTGPGALVSQVTAPGHPSSRTPVGAP